MAVHAFPEAAVAWRTTGVPPSASVMEMATLAMLSPVPEAMLVTTRVSLVAVITAPASGESQVVAGEVLSSSTVMVAAGEVCAPSV